MKLDANTVYYNQYPVRIATTNNNKYYVLIDIAKILGFKDCATARSKANLKMSDVEIAEVTDERWIGKRLNVVNSSGLNKLIGFSTKPEREDFKRWAFASNYIPLADGGNSNGENVTTEEPPISLKKESVQATIQKAGLLVRIAEHKAVPFSEQLRLLDLAVKELTGFNLNLVNPTQAQVDSNIMSLPEVIGSIHKTKKIKIGEHNYHFHPAEDIASIWKMPVTDFNKFADNRGLKNIYNGIWERVTTHHGDAREFLYYIPNVNRYYN